MYKPTPIEDYVVTPMPDGTWRVWNEEKDTNYQVYLAPNNKWKCTCPDWEFRCKKWGVNCNHIRAVRRYEKGASHDKLGRQAYNW